MFQNVKSFLFIFLLFISYGYNAQSVGVPVGHTRAVDYQYLSAPDSAGYRTPLKTPSPSRTQQLKLPYPILFIHGLWSNSQTWDSTTNFMDTQYGLTFGGRFDFCLNYDGDYYNANTNFYPTAGADLAYFTGALTAGDYYYLNFDVGTDGSFHPNGSGFDMRSNQAAITKQGLAVKWAIYFILQQTGRDKVVLMGHSMGGLASREYLQNPANWQPDGQSHVAKLVTTGTPHGGSNIATAGILYGPDGQSEAIRDLRRSYYYTSNPGVYLFGGVEDVVYMEDQFCCYFYNADVNCNGIISETIAGLNQKTIYTDVDYSCIIGECPNCPIDSYQGDGVVNDTCANLNDYYAGLNASLFYYTDSNAVVQIHTDLPKQHYHNMQGLDEPNEYPLAYGISFDTVYTAFTTVQPVGGFVNDYDDFKFSVADTSNVTVTINNIFLPDLMFRILDTLYNLIGTVAHSGGTSTINVTQFLYLGTYYLEIYGLPTTTSYLTPYNFVIHQTTVTTGIEATEMNDEVIIYPNPTDGLFQISTLSVASKFEIKSVKAYNLLGERITDKWFVVNASTVKIDMTGYAKGVYFVEVETAKGKLRKKIVIQ